MTFLPLRDVQRIGGKKGELCLQEGGNCRGSSEELGKIRNFCAAENRVDSVARGRARHGYGGVGFVNWEIVTLAAAATFLWRSASTPARGRAAPRLGMNWKLGPCFTELLTSCSPWTELSWHVSNVDRISASKTPQSRHRTDSRHGHDHSVSQNSKGSLISMNTRKSCAPTPATLCSAKKTRPDLMPSMFMIPCPPLYRLPQTPSKCTHPPAAHDP